MVKESIFSSALIAVLIMGVQCRAKNRAENSTEETINNGTVNPILNTLVCNEATSEMEKETVMPKLLDKKKQFYEAKRALNLYKRNSTKRKPVENTVSSDNMPVSEVQTIDNTESSQKLPKKPGRPRSQDTTANFYKRLEFFQTKDAMNLQSCQAVNNAESSGNMQFQTTDSVETSQAPTGKRAKSSSSRTKKQKEPEVSDTNQASKKRKHTEQVSDQNVNMDTQPTQRPSMTNAEIQKRYRERKKLNDPEFLKKERERAAEVKRIKKTKPKENVDMGTQRSKTPFMTNAEKQKIYRESKKLNDPEFLKKERERVAKAKKKNNEKLQEEGQSNNNSVPSSGLQNLGWPRMFKPVQLDPESISSSYNFGMPPTFGLNYSVLGDELFSDRNDSASSQGPDQPQTIDSELPAPDLGYSQEFLPSSPLTEKELDEFFSSFYDYP